MTSEQRALLTRSYSLRTWVLRGMLVWLKAVCFGHWPWFSTLHHHTVLLFVQNNPFYSDVEIDEQALNALPAECSSETGAPSPGTISSDVHAQEPARVHTSHVGSATYEDNETAVRNTVQLLPPQQTAQNVQDMVERLGAFVSLEVAADAATRTSSPYCRDDVQCSHCSLAQVQTTLSCATAVVVDYTKATSWDVPFRKCGLTEGTVSREYCIPEPGHHGSHPAATGSNHRGHYDDSRARHVSFLTYARHLVQLSSCRAQTGWVVQALYQVRTQ